ncbi:MAG: hypothetical protein H6747_05650 [Deltaproteobacteria bacterium]|nr:hypothetical protein [Deltaproteobacteria bacterium]
MIPTLIDLHVRAGADALDPTTLRDAAAAEGLDGMLLVAPDAAPALDVGVAGEGEGAVLFFVAAELDTDVGRLICVPAAADDWFRGRGWAELKGEADAYPAAAVAGAFAERGGAVIVAQPFDRDLDHDAQGDVFVGTEGLHAVVVTSSPRHTTSNERAVATTKAAGLRAVGGSAAAPGEPRFGGVATVFAEPPVDQAGLVAALRGGRLWPAEMVPARESSHGNSAGSSDDGANNGNDDDGGDAERSEGRGGRAPKEKKGRTIEKKGKAGRGGREDNRGNRLDPVLLRTPMQNPWDHRQPDFDPIAKLYGLADRHRADRWSGKSDDELDRVNGNRTRGNDPNVMAAPDFRELRAERQHVGLLLDAIDHNDEFQESVALRFAVQALERVAEEEGVSTIEAAETLASQHGGGGGGGTRRKRRRRRN